jgi:hypothetical protein
MSTTELPPDPDIYPDQTDAWKALRANPMAAKMLEE